MILLNLAKNDRKTEAIAVISVTVTLRHGNLGIIIKVIKRSIQKCINIQGVLFKIRKLIATSGITGCSTTMIIF